MSDLKLLLAFVLFAVAYGILGAILEEYKVLVQPKHFSAYGTVFGAISTLMIGKRVEQIFSELYRKIFRRKKA